MSAGEPESPQSINPEASELAAPVLDYRAEEKPSLTHRTAKGFAWMLAQTVGTKVVNLLLQVVLAWLLTKSDYGLVALAYAVGSFPAIIRDAGISQILVHRQKRIHLWSGMGFWMALVMGILAGVIIFVAGLVAYARHRPDLGGLLLVLSMSSPISVLATIPNAKLLADLRFKAQAMISFWFAVVNAILSIALAARPIHAGAYAVIIAWVGSMAFRTVITWWLARPTMRWRPQVRRWKYLLRDTRAIMGTALIANVMAYGDYLTLGFFYDDAVVGVFFFAFNLSMQTFILFSQNLASVLFPALSKLKEDPQRQVNAFLRAAKTLAVIAIPLCFLQLAVAKDLMIGVFGSKWVLAITPFAILSAGTAIRVVGSPGTNLINAQGRWMTNFIMAVCYAIGFVVFVVTAAVIGKHTSVVTGATAVAIAETVYFCIIDPLSLYIAIKPAGGSLRNLAEVYVPSLLAGIIATAVGWGAAQFVPSMRFEHWVRILVTLLCAMGVYIPLIHLLAPEGARQVRERASGVLRRR